MVVSANRLELLQIADAVAREKAIDRGIVIAAMEDAIQKAARSRYGSETEVRAEINPKTGEMRLSRLLLVVDLAQAQNRPLHALTASQPMILDDAEVAVVLAVLFSVGAAQEHGNSRMPEFWQERKRAGLHSAVFRELVLWPKGLGPTLWRKAAGTAKVRLTTGTHQRPPLSPTLSRQTFGKTY